MQINAHCDCLKHICVIGFLEYISRHQTDRSKFGQHGSVRITEFVFYMGGFDTKMNEF